MRLLLIGDDPLIRDSLAELLLDHGYDVQTAESGEIGLVTFCRAAIDGAPFEAVITDLGRPHIDGTKVIDRILAIAPGTRTVLLTGAEMPVRIAELCDALSG